MYRILECFFSKKIKSYVYNVKKKGGGGGENKMHQRFFEIKIIKFVFIFFSLSYFLETLSIAILFLKTKQKRNIFLNSLQNVVEIDTRINKKHPFSTVFIILFYLQIHFIR